MEKYHNIVAQKQAPIPRFLFMLNYFNPFMKEKMNFLKLIKQDGCNISVYNEGALDIIVSGEKTRLIMD